MTKSNLTMAIERGAIRSFKKLGTFICPEVGITIFEDIETNNNYDGNTYIYHKRNTEIVDLLAWNTKDQWYCYEIKITKQDFYSKCAKTFVGNYNYYIMPKTLYEQVEKDIPKHVGVYIVYEQHAGMYAEPHIIKRSIHQELKVPVDVLKYSMIKSLYRENETYRIKDYHRHKKGGLND